MAWLSSKTLDLIAYVFGIRQDKGPFKEEKFSFYSVGQPAETFGVIKFSGTEGLSQLYDFDLHLISQQEGLDPEKILAAEAVLLVQRENLQPTGFRGILASFEQLHQAHGFTFYRARLVPKLWRLTLTCHNQVFLDRTVPEIIQDVLGDGGLGDTDYDLRLQGDYSRKWEFVCQYKESHYNFLSRWLEREGLYYFFETVDETEKLIITDINLAHVNLPEGAMFRYSLPSGLEHSRWREVVSNFNCCTKPVPKSILLNDYNYRLPSLDLTSRAEVSAGGFGEVYLYGDHFRTPEEGARVAKVRAEELLCLQKTYQGKSSIPFLRPGFTFNLTDHYDRAFNANYLLTEVKHEGNQTGYLVSGLRSGLAEDEKALFYRNTFTSIPANIQYRAARRTESPRFHGVINARIDAEGSGQYAELDEWGRYKVLLPFDLSGRQGGKASAWLRMAQPYVGSNHGMHFPLHKGTEVLLTFIDGDPDRPIISAAVPNPEAPSLVTAASATRAGIRSAGGSGILFEDTEGQERMVLRSGDDNAQISLGRGSLSEIFTASTNTNNYSSLLSTSAVGWLGSYMSIKENQMIAGFKKAQLLFMTLDTIFKNGPTLVSHSVMKQYGTPDKWTSLTPAKILGSTAIFAPIAILISTIINNVVKAISIGAYLAAPQGKFQYPAKPAILLGRTSQGQAVKLNSDDAAQDIVLANDKDNILIFAQQSVNVTALERDVSVVANQELYVTSNRNVHFSAEKGKTIVKTETLELSTAKHPGFGETGIKIGTDEFGSVQIACGGKDNPQAQITLNPAGEVTIDKAQNINITAMTKVTIQVGASKIVIQENQITIDNPNEVKVKDLTIQKQYFQYNGQGAAIANVLRIVS